MLRAGLIEMPAFFFFFNLDSFDAISLGERSRNGIEGKLLPAGIEPDSLSYTFSFFFFALPLLLVISNRCDVRWGKKETTEHLLLQI